MLNDVVYNIGGRYSTSSVCWLHLLSGKWSSIQTVGENKFTDYRFRDATVVNNQIVYFGYYNEEATYVLEEKSENLELKSKFAPIDYFRGS